MFSNVPRSIALPYSLNTTVKTLTISVLLLTCLGCTQDQEQKEEQEWITLFNGQDLTDWIVKINHHDVGVNYGDTFRISDGILEVRYDQYGDFNEQFGHLYFKQPYSYYHLVVEST